MEFGNIFKILPETILKPPAQTKIGRDIAKIILYSTGEEDLVLAQLVFYNKSINRDLSSCHVIVGDDKVGHYEDITCFHAHSGTKDFEDVFNVKLGSFSDFKEYFYGKTIQFAFHMDEEAKDYLCLKFRLNLAKADLVIVDYLTNVASWKEDHVKLIEPLLETKVRLVKERDENSATMASIEKAENKSTGIGCLGAVAAAILIYVLVDEIGVEVNFWIGALIGILIILPIWLGAKIGKKKNKDKRDFTTAEGERLRKEENKLDNQIVDAAY